MGWFRQLSRTIPSPRQLTCRRRVHRLRNRPQTQREALHTKSMLRAGNINPLSCAMTREHGVKDDHLPQPIRELGILNRIGSADRGIKTTKDLLECVVVTFAVSSGEIGVASRSPRQKRRIFYKN